MSHSQNQPSNIHTLGPVGLSKPATYTTKKPSYQVAARDFAAFYREEAILAFEGACHQMRTDHRLVDLLVGGMFATAGSGTIADAIRANGSDQEDWTADYRTYSEARVDPIAMFAGVFRAAIPLLPEGPVILALDDTVLPKRGKGLPMARWCHNPLCPPWIHPALQWGHPCFHAALVVWDDRTHKAQALTVAFEPVPGLTAGKAEAEKAKARSEKAANGNKTKRKWKRPEEDDGRTHKEKREAERAVRKKGRPTKEEAERRKQEELVLRAKYPSAPDVAVTTINRVRGWMDAEGMQDRLLIVVGDGSYTNATVFFNLPPRCVYVGRCRPDAYLRMVGEAKPGGGFYYGDKCETPRAMATNKKIPETSGKFTYGGDVRELAFKNIGPCCRVASTRKQLMRLLILKPKGYISAGKRNYSHEAFLLTSDFTVGPEVMIQAYLRRWSIEVQHRDLKSLARLGKAQVRCREAVATAHAAMAAAFSLLWICALKKFGAARTDSHVPVALWQKKNWIQRGKKRVAEGKREPVVRATSADVLALLREGSFSGWSGGLARCA